MPVLLKVKSQTDTIGNIKTAVGTIYNIAMKPELNFRIKSSKISYQYNAMLQQYNFQKK